MSIARAVARNITSPAHAASSLVWRLTQGMGWVGRGVRQIAAPLTLSLALGGVAVTYINWGWAPASALLSGLTLLGAIGLAMRARRHTVIEDFVDHAGSTVTAVPGLASMIAAELASLGQLYASLEGGPAGATKAGAPVEPSLSLDEVADILNGVVTPSTAFRLGPLTIPIGAVMTVAGRYLRSPHISGAVHRGDDSVVILVRYDGKPPRVWRATAPIAATVGRDTASAEGPPVEPSTVAISIPQRVVEDLACQIFAELGLGGSVKWRAVQAFNRALDRMQSESSVPFQQLLGSHEVEEQLEKALQEDVSFDLAAYHLALLSRKANRLAAARSFLLAALDKNGSRWETTYALAMLKGDPRTRELLCRQVIDTCRDAAGRAQAHDLVAALLRESKASMSAVLQERRRASRAAWRGLWWAELTRAPSARGDGASGAARLDRRRKVLAQCLTNKAHTLIEAWNRAVDEATHSASETSSSRPEGVPRFALLQAETLLCHAAAVAPLDAEIHYRLSRVFHKSGRSARAVEELRCATRMETGNPKYWARLVRSEMSATGPGRTRLHRMVVQDLRGLDAVAPLLRQRTLDKVVNELSGFMSLRPDSEQHDLGRARDRLVAIRRAEQQSQRLAVDAAHGSDVAWRQLWDGMAEATAVECTWAQARYAMAFATYATEANVPDAGRTNVALLLEAALAQLDERWAHCARELRIHLDGAKWLFGQGRLPAAERVVQAAIDARPLDVDAWSLAGDISSNLSDLGEARHRYSRGLRMAKEALQVATVSRSLATTEAQIADGCRDRDARRKILLEATDHLNAASSVLSHDDFLSRLHARYWLGIQDLNLGELDDAVDHLRASCGLVMELPAAHDPDGCAVFVRLALANAELANGQLDTAAGDYCRVAGGAVGLVAAGRDWVRAPIGTALQPDGKDLLRVWVEALLGHAETTLRRRVGVGSSEQLLAFASAVCKHLDNDSERTVLARIEALRGLVDTAYEHWGDAIGHFERSIHHAEDAPTYLDLGDACMGELRVSDDPVRRFVLRQRIEDCCRQVVVIDLRDDHNRRAAALMTLAGDLSPAPSPREGPHDNGQMVAGAVAMPG